MNQKRIKGINYYECKHCKLKKHKDEFSPQPSGYGHYKVFCKDCENKSNKEKDELKFLLSQNKRKCTKCGEVKDLSQFHKKGRKEKYNGILSKYDRQSHCNSCASIKRHNNYLNNKEHELARNKKYNETHKEEMRLFKREYE